jgi:uncharacterized protein YifN (PemK superfamily)
MASVPFTRSIWHCSRDTEGRKNSCPFRCHNSNQNISISKNHWFVVISRKNDQDFVTVLPFTSTPSQEERNNGISLGVDDITAFSKSPKTFNPTKQTFALCNKICRIPREDLEEDTDWGMIKKPKYNELIFEIRMIMRDAN